MPKSNVDFWTKKFAENIKRDQRVERELVRQGWRVVVVWECDLVKHTIETIEGVSHWLCHRTGDAGQQRSRKSYLDRRGLLEIAEEKVRYRIDFNNGDPGLVGSRDTPEDQQP